MVGQKIPPSAPHDAQLLSLHSFMMLETNQTHVLQKSDTHTKSPSSYNTVKTLHSLYIPESDNER